MDRRVERTRAAIADAFLELRAAKPLEKISVKELCERADVNKSTFYTHYQDIYDLAEQLESQVAEDILAEIGHPERMLTEPDAFTRELYLAYLAHGSLITTLFSGSRSDLLVVRIERSLMESLHAVRPDLRDNATVDTVLTLEIYGQYYAFMRCRHFGDEQVIDVLCSHWRHSVETLREIGVC